MRRVEEDAVGRTYCHAAVALRVPSQPHAGSEMLVVVRQHRKGVWNASFGLEVDSGRRIREYFTLQSLVEALSVEERVFRIGVIRCKVGLPTYPVIQR